ncbi:hypothetical protein QC761_0078430 [Podospora bellae-mahoneyi]|uniref:Uncharacterized protein n=1 Tax=Podospora bellae-mahoneyi TaxID=2093777 RepID=A0ABR0FD18_9PEZI|nr:hypothetical protein QC761_0078430 [Podospora bellae-mahoneyi]
MQNQLPIPLHRLLQVPHPQPFIIPMRNKDTPRPIEITRSPKMAEAKRYCFSSLLLPKRETLLLLRERRENSFMPRPEVSSPTTKRSITSDGEMDSEERRVDKAMSCAAREAFASTEPRPEMRVSGVIGPDGVVL